MNKYNTVEEINNPRMEHLKGSTSDNGTKDHLKERQARKKVNDRGNS